MIKSLSLTGFALWLMAGTPLAAEESGKRADAKAAQERNAPPGAITTNAPVAARGGDTLQLDTLVVEGRAETEKAQSIESRTLTTHKVVDLAEILSDEMVEVQMIRKSGYGNEESMRGLGKEKLRVVLDGGNLEGACGSRKDPSLSHINMLTVDDIIIRQGPFDVTKPGCLGGYVDVVTKKPRPVKQSKSFRR